MKVTESTLTLIRQNHKVDIWSLMLWCTQTRFSFGRQMEFFVQEHYALPVGGGAGVEDVLFGREQRQAVGIKVDRSRAHDGKSFQTTPAASLFTGPDGFRGRCICWKTATAEHRGSFTAEKTAVKVWRFMQSGLKSSKLERSVQALRTHSVEETATAHWSGLCAAGQNKFSLKSHTSRWESGKHNDFTSWVTWKKRNHSTTRTDHNCLMHPPYDFHCPSHASH